MMKQRPVRGADKLLHSVARNFIGGLNTYDSPLNLATRFATKLVNLYPDSNGGLRVRYGVAFFSDAAPFSVSSISAMTYYNSRLVVVDVSGRIVVIDGAGNVSLAWNGGWGATQDASFTPFEGKLVICNGLDKPVYMDELYTVRYVADAATGSNVNVPRAKFAATHNGYLVLARSVDDFGKLYICAKGTLGTFYGDEGVDNDAVNFDTSQYIMTGDADITGMVSFRDFLVVGYANNIIAIKLGTLNDAGEHIPTVVDSVPDVGVISNNCLVPVGDTLFALSTAGLSSLIKTTVSGQLRDTRESTLVGKELRTSMQKFSPAAASVAIRMQYDPLLQHLLILVPREPIPTRETQNDVFVLCLDKQQRLRAWTTYDNMPYRACCRSAEGRIFFGAGPYVFRMYNEIEPGHFDPFNIVTQPWSDGTAWSDSTAWEVGYAPATAIPLPIHYKWTMPWADMQSPATVKHSRYISVIAEGTSDYTIHMLTDRFTDPVLSMDLRNTENPTDTPGVNVVQNASNNDQLYAWSMPFRRMAIEIEGDATDAMRFVGVNMYYLNGGMKR